MASIHSVTNGDTGKYVDIDGHRVRKYDLRLSRIPQLDYNDPQVESIIANEVSLTTTYTVSAQVLHTSGHVQVEEMLDSYKTNCISFKTSEGL